MSAPRRARARKRDITELQWAFLNDALPHDDERVLSPDGQWEYFELRFNTGLGDRQPIVDELWAEYGPAVLARWVEEKPGTRPSLWWVYDAPRIAPGTYGHFGTDNLPEPRRRISGRGTALHDCLAYVPSFECGLPRGWLTAGNGWVSGGEPVDPNDPPAFESQAAYLERHGLFLPGERKRLKKADFAPEQIECVE